MTKSTALEMQDRYQIVQDLIIQGYSGADVYRWICDNTNWDISRRHAYNYYDNAFEALSENSNVNRASYFKLCIERLEHNYQKAAKANDYKEASKITMYLVDLLKLDNPKAEFDWTAKATEAGINPVELKERFKRLMLEDEKLESVNGQ